MFFLVISLAKLDKESQGGDVLRHGSSLSTATAAAVTSSSSSSSSVVASHHIDGNNNATGSTGMGGPSRQPASPNENNYTNSADNTNTSINNSHTTNNGGKSVSESGVAVSTVRSATASSSGRPSLLARAASSSVTSSSLSDSQGGLPLTPRSRMNDKVTSIPSSLSRSLLSCMIYIPFN